MVRIIRRCPPYAAFMKSRSHLAFAAFGEAVRPVHLRRSGQAADLYQRRRSTPARSRRRAVSIADRPVRRSPARRRTLLQQFDRMRAGLDLSGSMDALDVYQRQAVDMLLGERARKRFRSRSRTAGDPRSLRQAFVEPTSARRAKVGRGGTAFVTLDLSHHTAFGHLGHARRQHPAVRRHQKRSRAAPARFDHLSRRSWPTST